MWQELETVNPNEHKSELDAVINRASGVRRERRLFLAKTALFFAAHIGAAWSEIDNGQYEQEVDAAVVAVEVSYDERAPDEATQDEALQFKTYLDIRDDEPYKSPDYVPAAEIEAQKNLPAHIDEETLTKLRESHESVRAHEEAVEAAVSEVLQDYPSRSWRTIGALALGWHNFAFFTLRETYNKIRQRPQLTGSRMDTAHKKRTSMHQFVYEAHSEWRDDPPSVKQLRKEHKKYVPASRLPTVGAKFIRLYPDGRSHRDLMDPTTSAELMAKRIINEARSSETPSLAQLTVQGRLHDEFKYAATALVLGNPMPMPDWKEPFYNAPWGGVAPMIHDGGRENVHHVNRDWAGIEGRTDFIMRIIPKKANVIDQASLTDDIRFWQRAALALHCKQGTAPETIDAFTQQALAEIWLDFEKGMKKMIKMMGAENFDDVPWFLTEARALKGWRSHRYEGDSQPIGRELNKLELERSINPEFIEFARRAMSKLSEKVDDLLTSDEQHQRETITNL